MLTQLFEEEGEEASQTEAWVNLLSPDIHNLSDSERLIKFGKMERPKKKVDTSAKPNIRYEIHRLARVFAGWLPDNMPAADRNKQEPTVPQLWAILYALKGGVTAGQIAETIGVTLARAQQIIRDANAIQTKENDGLLLRISGGSIELPHSSTDSPLTMAERVKQKISIKDTSPRI